MTDSTGKNSDISMMRDVIILGGGLIGMTMALSLAEHGISSHLVEKHDPAAMLDSGFDGRTSAIISSSWNMFKALGLETVLEGKGCPIRRIEVREGTGGKPLDFTPDDNALGMIFENTALRRALWGKVSVHDMIAVHAGSGVALRDYGAHGASVTLDNGVQLNGALVIAADGRNSPTRRDAGINMATWKYEHRAIVTAITHDLPHDNIAHEMFFASGPFALLPMHDTEDGQNRSSLIWTVPEKDGDAMLKLSERGFLTEMQKYMQNMLGGISLAAPRSSYPLGLHHTAQITSNRLALVGDSAHGIHPIAGQGLNLGLRDVAALTEVLVSGARIGLDYGDTQLLDRYANWRSLDTLMVAAASDNLTRLFGMPGRAPSLMRKAGLAAVQNIPMLKSIFMDEARGRSGELPKLLQGAKV